MWKEFFCRDYLRFVGWKYCDGLLFILELEDGVTDVYSPDDITHYCKNITEDMIYDMWNILVEEGGSMEEKVTFIKLKYNI